MNSSPPSRTPQTHSSATSLRPQASTLHYLAIQKPGATKRLPALLPPRIPTL